MLPPSSTIVVFIGEIVVFIWEIVVFIGETVIRNQHKLAVYLSTMNHNAVQYTTWTIYQTMNGCCTYEQSFTRFLIPTLIDDEGGKSCPSPCFASAQQQDLSRLMEDKREIKRVMEIMSRWFDDGDILSRYMEEIDNTLRAGCSKKQKATFKFCQKSVHFVNDSRAEKIQIAPICPLR